MQLPTYSGTKSYQNLLVEVYGMVVTGNARYADSQIQATPLNFIRNGIYHASAGTPFQRNEDGFYWPSGTANTKDYVSHMAFYSTALYTHAQTSKGYGLPLRCLER